MVANPSETMRLAFTRSLVVLAFSTALFVLGPSCTGDAPPPEGSAPQPGKAVDGTPSTSAPPGTVPGGGNPTTPTPGGGAEEPDPVVPTSPAADAGVAAQGCIFDGDPYDVVKLRAHLSYLASPELAGRAPGTPGDVAARSFVEARFKCLGLLPGGAGGSYFQPFVDSEGHATANVVGFIPGTDSLVGGDIIIIGAHLDHFGTVGGGALRLGANDNASGVTSVLTAAQAIKQRGTPPKRTIAFFAYASEEIGCEGSRYYIDRNSLAALPLSRVVYNINYDMVGTYTQTGGSVEAHGSFATTPGLAVLRSLLGPTPALKVNLEVPGLDVDDSDYYPFCEAGIPIVGFFTDDPICYHRACDTAEKIDYPNLSRIAKLGADLAIGLSDGATDLAGFRRQAAISALGCK